MELVFLLGRGTDASCSPKAVQRGWQLFLLSCSVFLGQHHRITGNHRIDSRWRWDWRPPSSQHLHFWVVLVEAGNKCLFSAQRNRHLPWGSHHNPGCKKCCWISQITGSCFDLLCSGCWTASGAAGEGQPDVRHVSSVVVPQPCQPLPVGNPESLGSGSGAGSLSECQDGGWALCQSQWRCQRLSSALLKLPLHLS